MGCSVVKCFGHVGGAVWCVCGGGGSGPPVSGAHLQRLCEYLRKRDSDREREREGAWVSQGWCLFSCMALSASRLSALQRWHALLLQVTLLSCSVLAHFTLPSFTPPPHTTPLPTPYSKQYQSQAVPYTFSIASVKRFIWKRSDDVIFHYRILDPARLAPFPNLGGNDS